ncbi:MarR family winged helix-turn-helix transcriptional regulator [Pseudohoeflea coraliihabitans]|uniref:MarR family transcriptional regulator n=1 Tax=Pseudohoeflea coraliihabitans TaxID=2860393 RepID=A0ABS6WM59_9HYPH|nr:winged helix DNA-binding protein [Pseudohoeflea sp. DP4N28-3]MBW3097033.1 MarR family transcriptional regulator [Pseudohoeflea sp. DP4N28-3]
MTEEPVFLRDLLDRLARIIASEGWTDDLNPTQRAALSYLARANRFSRAPSHVADYLCATRGTVSQTLKALARKDLVREVRSETDRRSIAYILTECGERVAQTPGALDDVLRRLDPEAASTLAQELASLLRHTLAERGGRSFGMCHTCRHHQSDGEGGWCRLLKVDLKEDETRQLCHEHAWAA